MDNFYSTLRKIVAYDGVIDRIHFIIKHREEVNPLLFIEALWTLISLFFGDTLILLEFNVNNNSFFYSI